ncbi:MULTISPECIES: hypothetical protein [unclassified Paenibacillus]|uniref:hypothetical protein n=1 Tax=unclassified Paenibacillus TaxID=185978 RepID=UPI001AE8286F|nr:MULTISPECIES: hypothetical protein [unclassified Paenibacillus]MBP1157081.1 hypothetical protein [Paenibacillus sp. PvP091]MBP1172180.1 hypothetical protein [Paenibacillus sp. PvR098]MBP2438561.1 hypothetical protein [Paenibacillus sp. PvP052]
MKPIHPISVKGCKAYYGKPVCVILKDGAQLVGILSRLEKGKLILNDEPAVRLKVKTKKSGAKKGKTGVNTKKALEAQTTAYPYAPSPVQPFGGGRIILDPALIAMLFALS